MSAYWATYESPIGPLTLLGQDGSLRQLRFPGHRGRLREEHHRPESFGEASTQLRQYFAGERQAFELPPGDAREVGAAVARTPLPILIPCHRVIGSNGDLVGYGGGLERKQTLLDLEASVSAGRPPDPAWAFRQLSLS